MQLFISEVNQNHTTMSAHVNENVMAYIYQRIVEWGYKCIGIIIEIIHNYQRITRYWCKDEFSAIMNDGRRLDQSLLWNQLILTSISRNALIRVDYLYSKMITVFENKINTISHKSTLFSHIFLWNFWKICQWSEWVIIQSVT